jgi:hypothetical protein
MLYCYYDGHEYHMHVAENQRVKGFRQSRSKDQRKRFAYLMEKGFVPFENKHAGKSFSCKTLKELKSHFIALSNDGVHIPKYAFDRVNRELKEEEKWILKNS